MLEFLSNNWVWILLIGSMALMHLGHGGHGGGHGGHAGCGGGGHKHTETPEDTGASSQPVPRNAPQHEHGAAHSDPTRRW